MKEYVRYGVVKSKLNAEVVMLKGMGCTWGKCSFCDFCKDCDTNINSNYATNAGVLANVKGITGRLFVICSGSFVELDSFTIREIMRVAYKNDIHTLIFEGHWQHRHLIQMYKEIFSDFDVKFNIGAETFNIAFREDILNKGMGCAKATDIRKHFDWCNILIGIKGQTLEGILDDITIALSKFEFVSINVFTPNSTSIERDYELMAQFYDSKDFKHLIKMNNVIILDDLNPKITDSFAKVGSEVTK